MLKEIVTIQQALAEKVEKFKTLSRREREVFELLVCDVHLPEVARSLGISPKTVAVHKHNICSKLNIQTRVGMALLVQHLPTAEATNL